MTEPARGRHRKGRIAQVPGPNEPAGRGHHQHRAAADVRVAPQLGQHVHQRRPGDVPVERTCPDCGRPHGRPRLDLPGAPQLSVSHSGLLVVVAAHDGPVGVDVQRIADVPAGTDAGAWVRDEAVVKAGLVAGAAQVLGLSPPLPGYASALALPMAYAGGRVAQHDAAALLTP